MILTAYFNDRGVPKTGLSPTITVRKVTDGTVLVNAAAMAEVGSGFYRYSYAGYNRTVEIAFICDGGAGLENPDRYAIGSNRDDLERVANGLTTQEKTNVLTESNAALVANNLDELLISSMTPPFANSVIDLILNKDAGQTYDRTTGSLEKLALVQGAIVITTNNIQAKTDNLPLDPADESNVLAAIGGVDTKATAIQAKTDLLQFDGSNNIQARINNAGVLAADIATILSQANKLTFDGLNNIQARINDAGIIDATFIADAVWNALTANYISNTTMGQEQYRLTIEASWSPDLDVIDAMLEPLIDPIIIELHYRSLTGNPDYLLNVSNIYGAFASYLIYLIRNGVPTIVASGPFTDIAEDQLWGVRASFQISDYQAGDVFALQVFNLQFYIRDRFYWMPSSSKILRISPENTITAIKDQTDLMQFDGSNNILANIADVGSLATNFTALENLLNRILGLTHENVYVVNTFTGNVHTGSIVETYDSKANANNHDGITGLVAKYTLTVNLMAGLPVSHKMVKEP